MKNFATLLFTCVLFCTAQQAHGQALIGDSNCDGVIDLLDVSAFVDDLSDSGTYHFKSDANRDGVVDLLDANVFVTIIVEFVGTTNKVCTGGDVDGNGRIDLLDIGEMNAAIKAFNQSDEYNPLADLNRNGSITLVDLQILGDKLGR